MTARVIGVLALQGDVPEHLRALEDVGARAVPVRRPEELHQLDGLVIPGGESTTLWRLSVAFDMLEPLRKLIASGLPAFGSCAGMIMLADRLADGVAGQLTYGGIDMSVRRNAFGRQVDSFESDITLSGVPTNANPLGVKGSGQAGAMAAPQAIIAAVLDALAPLGVTHIDMPATPQRVWTAITEARKASNQ